MNIDPRLPIRPRKPGEPCPVCLTPLQYDRGDSEPGRPPAAYCACGFAAPVDPSHFSGTLYAYATDKLGLDVPAYRAAGYLLGLLGAGVEAEADVSEVTLAPPPIGTDPPEVGCFRYTWRYVAGGRLCELDYVVSPIALAIDDSIDVLASGILATWQREAADAAARAVVVDAKQEAAAACGIGEIVAGSIPPDRVGRRFGACESCGRVDELDETRKSSGGGIYCVYCSGGLMVPLDFADPGDQAAQPETGGSFSVISAGDPIGNNRKI